MENDPLNGTYKPMTAVPRNPELDALERKIDKYAKRKSSSIAAIIFGLIAVGFWFFTFVSASITTSNNPASVAMLGPILYSPALVAGIVMLAIGIPFYFTSRAKINVLQEELNAIVLRDMSHRKEASVEVTNV